MTNDSGKTKFSYLLLACIAMWVCAGLLFVILLVFDRDWIRAIFGLCVLSGASTVIYGVYLKMEGGLIDDVSEKPGLRLKIALAIIGLLVISIAIFFIA